jgi:hypothetical protein
VPADSVVQQETNTPKEEKQRVRLKGGEEGMKRFVGFEVLEAVLMKDGIFRRRAPCR